MNKYSWNYCSPFYESVRQQQGESILVQAILPSFAQVNSSDIRNTRTYPSRMFFTPSDIIIENRTRISSILTKHTLVKCPVYTQAVSKNAYFFELHFSSFVD